eukprot:m51a1_g801 hypothetical protein (618) ;mRNA; f:656398-658795
MSSVTEVLALSGAPPKKTETVKLSTGLELRKYVSDRGHVARNCPADLTSLVARSDIVPGRYEGGFKMWECALDLAGVAAAIPREDLEQSDVLEVGCGHGMAGIAALCCGARSVHFADFNAEVLSSLTMHNVAANCGQETIDSHKARFFSGDWADLATHLAGLGLKYDIIMGSDTLYAAESHQKLHDLVKGLLKPGGSAYFAARKYYFGVGGGTVSFEEVVSAGGAMTCESHARFATKSGVEREVIRAMDVVASPLDASDAFSVKTDLVNSTEGESFDLSSATLLEWLSPASSTGAVVWDLLADVPDFCDRARVSKLWAIHRTGSEFTPSRGDPPLVACLSVSFKTVLPFVATGKYPQGPQGGCPSQPPEGEKAAAAAARTVRTHSHMSEALRHRRRLREAKRKAPPKRRSVLCTFGLVCALQASAVSIASSVPAVGASYDSAPGSLTPLFLALIEVHPAVEWDRLLSPLECEVLLSEADFGLFRKHFVVSVPSCASHTRGWVSRLCAWIRSRLSELSLSDKDLFIGIDKSGTGLTAQAYTLNDALQRDPRVVADWKPELVQIDEYESTLPDDQKAPVKDMEVVPQFSPAREEEEYDMNEAAAGFQSLLYFLASVKPN